MCRAVEARRRPRSGRAASGPGRRRGRSCRRRPSRPRPTPARRAVVLVGDLVHRVAARLVAVPHVDRGAGQRRAVAGYVEQLHRQAGGDAGRGAGQVAEARRDVAAHDAAVGERVRAVGAVARERAGGLLGDLRRLRGPRLRLRRGRIGPRRTPPAGRSKIVDMSKSII